MRFFMGMILLALACGSDEAPADCPSTSPEHDAGGVFDGGLDLGDDVEIVDERCQP